jgi:hypothetical protein
MYRVLVVKPNGDSTMINIAGKQDDTVHEVLSDSTLRQFIHADNLSFEADLQIRNRLEQRVKNIGRSRPTSKNSLFEIFIPLFSLKQMELKMALVCLALVFTLGIGPTVNQAPNRNLNLFFLADTLSDTSIYRLPAIKDTAERILYK